MSLIDMKFTKEEFSIYESRNSMSLIDLMQHFQLAIYLRKQKFYEPYRLYSDGSAILKSTKVEFNQKAGDTGRLYGAVTSQEISDALAKQGLPVDKKLFDMKEPIKEAGTHTVKVNIYKEIKSQLTVIVNAVKEQA